jgi:hypothetical protein
MKTEASPRLFGEIIACTETTKNEVPAVSGITTQNNDRIRTGESGGALIRLGSTGKIELGPGTEMKLQFSEDKLGGELFKGKLAVNVRGGVSIEMKTSKGLVAANTPSGLKLMIDLEKEGPFLTSLQGASPALSDRAETAEAKELKNQASSRSKFSRRSQFLTGLESSWKTIIKTPRGSVSRYESTMTCLKNETFACRKWGDVTP